MFLFSIPYAHSFGLPALQHTIATKIAELINSSENPEETLKKFDLDNIEEEEVEDEEMDDGEASEAIRTAVTELEEKGEEKEEEKKE